MTIITIVQTVTIILLRRLDGMIKGQGDFYTRNPEVVRPMTENKISFISALHDIINERVSESLKTLKIVVPDSLKQEIKDEIFTEESAVKFAAKVMQIVAPQIKEMISTGDRVDLPAADEPTDRQPDPEVGITLEIGESTGRGGRQNQRVVT